MAYIISKVITNSVASLVVLGAQTSAKSLFGEIPKDNSIDEMV